MSVLSVVAILEVRKICFRSLPLRLMCIMRLQVLIYFERNVEGRKVLDNFTRLINVVFQAIDQYRA